MKKMVILLCVFVIALIPTAAYADNLTDCSIADGVVEAVNYIDLTAPYTGMLETFNLRVGDTVRQDDILMQLMLTRIYAPIDGKINYIYAKTGDDAETICTRYGGLFGIEPQQLLQLECNTHYAYDTTENKTVHLGEKVFVRSNNKYEQTGEGVVISVTGKNYIVELTVVKDLRIDDSSLRIYRESNYKEKSCIGEGTVVRSNDTMVSGAGRVYSITEKSGSTITSGTLLAELMGTDAAPDASPLIIAPCDAVIGSIPVDSGVTVAKGQTLLRLYLTDKLEVKAEVDEVDLKNVKIGDTLSVKRDADKSQVIEGKVTRISSVGTTKSNAAYFDVYVSIPADNAKIGENASVYIPRS